MKIVNNTQNEIGYNIGNSSLADCGTIAAQQSTDLPNWDNAENVRVSFVALPPEPNGEPSPYSVTIPQSNTGMAVTIGLYYE